MWKEYLREIAPGCVLRPPAAPSDIAAVESALDLRFPDSLRTLLAETNGLYDPDAYLDIVWGVEQIGRVNQAYRQEDWTLQYMTFECLLFFAPAGVDGILFAYPISASGVVQDKNIIAWYPIEDSRPVVACSLRDYLTRWITGDLKI